MVRAKFTLTSIIKYNYGEGQTFKFNAVHDVSTEENRRFSKYTPSGTLEIFIDNPPAQEFFQLNKSYYLDFTEAMPVQAI